MPLLYLSSRDCGVSFGCKKSRDHDCMFVRSEQEFIRVAEEILDSKRDYPVICLMARNGEEESIPDIKEMRKVVGAGIPIYFFTDRYVAQTLKGALHVWWPAGDYRDRLLICEWNKNSSGHLQKLAEGLLEGRQLSVERRLALTERQRSDAQCHVNRLTQRLLSMQRELDRGHAKPYNESNDH